MLSNATHKRVSLFVDILMFICLIMLMLTPFGTQQAFGFNWYLTSFHMLFGVILTVLYLIHIVINLKWLSGTTKAWGKANTATKAKFWMMILVLIFMCASITTGIIWGLGIGASPVMGAVLSVDDISAFLGTIRFWHALTSWAAFTFTGIHIGLHLTKFISFTQKPKPKPAAPAE